ncbi:MAG: Protein-export membrane protein SecG [bacterium]|nr:Protein-export membrane protein SecG [bacterium]MCK6561325.1 preprotein translocase subunit SecG [bacterium]NUM66813.1 preprotein translocase subunit SecG [candidate division KSB1 bacterium]
MYGFLITIFLLVALLQTAVILMQASKGGGLAGSFGGSTMGTVFGTRGAATFLSKLTAILAASFMILALILGLMKSSSTPSSSLVGQERQERQTRTPSPADIGAPVVPGTQTVPAPAQQQPASPQQQ